MLATNVANNCAALHADIQKQEKISYGVLTIAGLAIRYRDFINCSAVSTEILAFL